MRKIVFALLSLVFGWAAYAGELVNLAPNELRAMQARGALVVDVRTPEEWSKTGMIPGSKGLTYFDSTGAYDKDGWLRQLQPLLATSPGQPVILVCRSGHRSATVGKMLVDEAGYAKVYQLEKGIRGWSEENQPLEGRCRSC